MTDPNNHPPPMRTHPRKARIGAKPMRLFSRQIMALSAVLAVAAACAAPMAALAQTAVPGYVEQLSGATRNGIGATILGGSGISSSAVPMGYQKLSSLAAATALTVPTGAKIALIHVSMQAVRFRDDGVDPTATIGQPLGIGVDMLYIATGLAALKFIEQTASATIDIIYYK